MRRVVSPDTVFGMRMAALSLCVIGVALPLTRLLVERVGPQRVIFVLALLTAGPIATMLFFVFVFGWRSMEPSAGRGVFTGLVLGAAIVGWVAYKYAPPPEPQRVETANWDDYFIHPGEITDLWGTEKFAVSGNVDTGYNLNAHEKVLVLTYAQAVNLKVENQLCRAAIGKLKECYFPRGGRLILQSKKGTTAYIARVSGN